jgi:isopenicillin-N N-acyltransferase-like protein
VSFPKSVERSRGVRTKGTGIKGKPFREVSASGSHSQIGLSLGKQCRDQVKMMESGFKTHVSSVPGLNLAKAQSYAKRALPASQKLYPEIIEELQGYSEGSGVPFETIWAMLFSEFEKGKGCTDIAVNGEWTKDDCVYAAHNNDVSKRSAFLMTIARIKPKDEPGFIGLCYGGMMPECGMNASGISLTGNFLAPNDRRLGIPKDLAVRRVLREASIYDAIKAAVPEGRGDSYNNIVCDPNGEIYSLEGSATAFDAIYAEDGWLVHTNHYTSPKMWRFEEDVGSRGSDLFSSILRYNRVRKLFRRELGKVDVSTFKKILSDHVGYPQSICRHGDPKLPEDDQSQTDYSVVFDVTNKVAWICVGNPCEGEYKKYEL